MDKIKFIKQVFLFSLPIILILLLPTITILVSREYSAVDDVVRLQDKDGSILFNFCCSNVRRQYKEALLNYRRPSLITLGTSRVLEFREKMFIEPEKFANLGQAIIGTTDIKRFGENFLASSTVKVILLELDFQMFNPSFFSPDISTILPENTLERFGSIVATNWRRIYSFYFDDKTSIKTLYNKSRTSPNIGLISIMTDTGFRSDGSYDYGHTLTTPEQKTDILEQIRNSAENARLSGQHGKTISTQALQDIADFLTLCKSHGIKVVGIMSPLPRATYNNLVSTEDGYKESVLTIPLVLKNIFAKSDFEFYDFSNAEATVGASDQEFVDPLHGSEIMYQRIAKYLSQNSQTLSPYINY